jgi:predicted DNA-binding transcriptional regulator AlpA
VEETTQQATMLLSQAEVSRRLGVSIGTLAVWRSSRRYPLPYVKVGGLVRYRESDVATFIASRIQNAEPSKPVRTSRRARRAA